MSWSECPVCSQRNAQGSMRCSACGADFSDPDVMAMMTEGGGDAPVLDVEIGSLSHGRFFGFGVDGLRDGSALPRLAFVGIAMLMAGFLVPVVVGFTEKHMAWKALDYASSTALLFPVIAIVLGLGAAFAPLQSWQRSILLCLAGSIGLVTLFPIARLSGSPAAILPGILVGSIVGAWGFVLRAYNTNQTWARNFAVAGAVIVLIGFFIPVSEAERALPVELRFYLPGDSTLGTMSAFSAYKTVFNRDPMVFFSCVYLFLPLLLFPAGAALALLRPKGAWDGIGMLMRPLAGLAVLYVAVGFALFAFNVLGDHNDVVVGGKFIKGKDFTSGAILGRLRLFLLAIPFGLWATLPIVAISDKLGGQRQPDVDKAQGEAE